MGKEIEILEAFLPKIPSSTSVPIGPGDDCAAIDTGSGELLLAAVDQLIGDVHYFRHTTTPEAAGAKLLKRNLSDIAAMGGRPLWALLTIADSDRSPEWIVQFCQSVAHTAQHYGVALCGGDTASLPKSANTEVSTLTILGLVAKESMLTRSGAKIGDNLYVTGTLGNSLASEHHLNFSPRLAEGQFLGTNHLATAAMDISDGLLLDAERLALSSNVAIQLDPTALPLRSGASVDMAMGDGEDYELLFTSSTPNLMELYPENLAPIHKIGRIVAPTSKYIICDLAGNNLQQNNRGGYEH